MRLCDVETGRQIHRMLGHANIVYCVAVSPDGRSLITVGSAVRFWDVRPGSGHLAPYREPPRGQELASLEGHRDIVDHVLFSGDGKSLVSLSEDGTARIWDVARRRTRAVLGHDQAAVAMMARSPDGTTLAAWSSFDPEGPEGVHGDIGLWDLATGRRLATFARGDDHVASLDFSPDGKALAVANPKGPVTLWDLKSHSRTGRLGDEQNPVEFLFFAGDSRSLVTGHTSGPMTLWDAIAGKPLKEFDALLKEREQDIPGDRTIRIVRPSPDGNLVATGTSKIYEDGFGTGLIRLWDVRKGEEGVVLRDHPSSLCRVRFSPDGKLLAGGDTGGGLILWDLATGRPRATLKGGEAMLYLVAFSLDGARLAAAYVDRTLRLWNLAGGKELARYEGHTDAIVSLEFSPDGSLFATSSRDNSVKLWDARPKAR